MTGLPPRNSIPRTLYPDTSDPSIQQRPSTSNSLAAEMLAMNRSGGLGSVLKFSDHLQERFYHDNSLDKMRAMSSEAPRRDSLQRRRSQSIETLNKISQIKEAQR